MFELRLKCVKNYRKMIYKPLLEKCLYLPITQHELDVTQGKFLSEF